MPGSPTRRVTVITIQTDRISKKGRNKGINMNIANHVPYIHFIQTPFNPVQTLSKPYGSDARQ